MSSQDQLEKFGNHLIEKGTSHDSITLEHVQVLYESGYHHFQAGSYQKAEELFSIVTKLSPFYPDGYYSLGICFYLQKKWEEAKKSLSIFRLLKPSSPDGLVYLGYCFLETGEPLEAKALLKSALAELDDQDPLYLEVKALLAREKE